MRLNYFILLLLIYSILGCTDKPEQTRIPIDSGTWRFVFELTDEQLPFLATLSSEYNLPVLFIHNGTDTTRASLSYPSPDSVRFELIPSGSVLHAKINSEQLLTGVWTTDHNAKKRIPFTAEHGSAFRFTSAKSSATISESYAVTFSERNGSTYPAHLVIQNSQGHLTGTFLTETGDYRFLEGDIFNESIHLSTFDGSHAFLFTARINGDSLVNGLFYSGTNAPSTWVGNAQKEVTLKSPETIISATDSSVFDFRLPNHLGDTLTWPDLIPPGKVVIVEFMGSWCPNCMDASAAIYELKQKYAENVEIIPIAFELTEDPKQADKRIRRLLPVDKYPTYLFGGMASKKTIAKSFPILSDFTSFPTLLFIDKNRRIRQIYAGFYGPGTGSYYADFMESSEKLIQEMVSQ